MDQKILRAIAHNGRVSWTELALLLGVTPPAVGERVRKLEDKGVILGYAARLDATQVGWALTAFVMVTLDHPKAREPFLAMVVQAPAIQECHHVAGEYDYLLKIRATSMLDLENTVSNVIKGLEGVSKTVTTIALSTVKEDPVRLPDRPC